MNSRHIPPELEDKIRKRDTQCVYCSIQFDSTNKKSQATREHIINDAKIITYENTTLCCWSCNASKWAKLLNEWLRSKYCIAKNIRYETVAEVVRHAIDKQLISNL